MNPRVRVRRAYEHLNLLQQQIIAFTDRDPYTVVRERKAHAGIDVAVFRLREEPPPELGAVFGDYLHNMRTALDNLVWQLVLLDGGAPDDETMFPVASDLHGFKSQAGKKLRGMTRPHIAAIEALQPYPTRQDAASRAVDAVHDFARIDRHRVVHPAFAVLNPDPQALTIHRQPVTAEFTVHVEYLSAGKPLEDGAPLARLRTTAAQPEAHVKMQVEFPIRMAFGERGLSAEALPAIWRQIALIVEGFASDF